MNYRFIDEAGKHVHELDDRYLIGVTTLIKEVFPPMLSWYGSGKALEVLGWLTSKDFSEDERNKSAGEALQKLQEMPVKDYLSLLDKAYKNHDTYKKSQGKKGTNTHEKAEIYIKECIKNGGEPLDWPTEGIRDFIDWAKIEVKKFLWSEAHCFHEDLWVGGICDFGFETKDGKIIVADYKTAKAIYWTNFVQCAGYGLLIEENGLYTAEGQKVGAVERVDGYMIFQQKEGGKPQVKWQFNTGELEQAFISAVGIYKQMQVFKNN